MRTFLIRLAALFLALVLIGTAVSNRTPVLILLPLTDLSIEMPLYGIFFSGLFFGVILTGLVLALPRWRGFIARRHAEKRADKAERTLSHRANDTAEKRTFVLGAIDKAQKPGQASPRTQP